MKNLVVVIYMLGIFVTIMWAQPQVNTVNSMALKTSNLKGSNLQNGTQVLMSEEDFLKKREALIIKHSHHDNTFAAFHKAMENEDTLSAEFWHWKIEQYLYGQYTEFQAIYDMYKKGRTFEDIYNISDDPFIGKADPAPTLHKLPDGHFSDYLPMSRTPGDSHYNDGKIYIAYEGALTDPYIASFDIQTHQWDGPYKAGHSTLSKNGRKLDSHGYPTMQQDVNGYFHITFGGHGGEKEDGLNPLSIDTAHAGGRFTHVVSDKPNDISSFSQQHDVSPFASYAQSSKMPNGDIYFFTRAGTHKSPWIYYKLKSGKKTFEPPVIITWPTVHKDDPMKVDMFYIKTYKASDTDILVTSMHHLCNFKEIHTKRHDDRFNAYYMRLDTTTDTFYNVQGEELTLPITKPIADIQTLVYDSVFAGTIVNDTLGLMLQSGIPAMSYEIRHPEPRHWKMATFEDGKWTSDQPMPGTTVWTLADINGQPINTIMNLQELDSNSESAAVIYRNAERETVFAIATYSENEEVGGQAWTVEREHFALTNAGMRMEVVRNDSGGAVGVVVNVSKGKARRLYLWHEGEIRPR